MLARSCAPGWLRWQHALLKEKIGRAPVASKLVFADGQVCDSRRPRTTVSFVDVVRKAYLERISLSATGYYATPGIHWDRVAGRGKPFHYFACGAAVTEVEVDGFTGMTRVLRDGHSARRRRFA